MLYHTAISAINITALLILDYIIRNSDITSAKAKCFFRFSILATILAIAAEISAVHFESSPAFYRVVHIIANVVGFSVSPFIPLLMGCAISKRRKKSSFIFWIPSVINFAASLLSLKFPVIFSIDLENAYFRGDFFWIYILSYGVGMAYLFLQTLAESIHYQNKNRSVLFVLFLFVVLGTSIQVVLPQMRLSWLCISLAIGLYYTYYCELYHQIDALTELLNRHAYESYIRKISGTKNVTILIFDIDDFKSINDEYGHPFGDYCLMAVSSQIKDTFSKMGLCFRIGGDEFCVISKSTEKSVILHFYQKFLDEVVSIRKAEARLPLVSIGYSFYDRKKSTIEEAIAEADWQMYCFKQNRENNNSNKAALSANTTD